MSDTTQLTSTYGVNLQNLRDWQILRNQEDDKLFLRLNFIDGGVFDISTSTEVGEEPTDLMQIMQRILKMEVSAPAEPTFVPEPVKPQRKRPPRAGGRPM